MIKIDKSGFQIPPILQSGKGFEETEWMKKQFDDFKISKFDFAGKNHWGHKSVKELLLYKIQHGKCCYCERLRPHTIEGDIEHFRPKSIYYWLAYDFSNLFYSCKFCNSTSKNDSFPLVDESKRAKNHYNQISFEDNLILHPEFDKIEEHITFEGAKAIPKNSSLKGKTTIEILDLNNVILFDERAKYLEIFTLLANLIRTNGIKESEKIESALNHFKKYSNHKEIFSLMIKANFIDLIQL
jgi:uncharacterized protein (TIGR02646 family)